MRYDQYHPDRRCPVEDVLPALVSIEVQRLNRVYDVEKAFMIGTLFPELDKPWMPYGGGRC